MPTPTMRVDPPASPVLEGIAFDHARRGVRLQVWLRTVLVVFIALTVLLIPPAHAAVACYAIVGVYTAWALGVAAWTRRGGPAPVRLAWLTLFVDLAVLAALTLLTGITAQQSWTSYVLSDGFFLIPVLAATQLSPGICAAVVTPTVVVSLASGVATQAANAEPWEFLVLRNLVMAGVGAGCITLSAIQRSRVMTISGLVQDRTDLLAELMSLEHRERRTLSEHLHDGPLQYVLAARQDLDDARDTADPNAFGRLEYALTESSRLLRSAVTELHPAVLDQAGLARALRELADTSRVRGGFGVDLDVRDWPDSLRTSADSLLFSVARELLANVIKHAEARSVTITLGVAGPSAHLVIADDGKGVPENAAQRGLAHGHIGLASHALRVEAAGGALMLTPAQPSGTVAAVELPYELSRASDRALLEARL